MTGRPTLPRKARDLSSLAVRGLTVPGLHFVGGVAGLALQVTETGARTWILRTVVAGRRRDMGLGAFPDVPLAEARDRARKAKEQVRGGVDPIEHARAARSLLAANRAAALTFSQCAQKYIESQEAGWRNAKHADQWRNTLKQYAFPTMGQLLVRDVTLSHVLAALEPIWLTKNETASRLRGRIELVLDWAAVRRYRDGDNPARWRGHLDKVLPKPSKVNGRAHHPAVALGDARTFMRDLRATSGLGARALELAILTAARSGEVRGACWAEFNTTEKIWAVPASRMKAGKEHRVPLSPAAADLLAALPKVEGTDLVFPSSRSGKPLSDMTLTAVMRRLKTTAVPHGFRSTFRDWAAERTDYPAEMAEMALAHTIGDKVESAYRRGDLFEKRRAMMTDWATFLSP